MALKKLMMMLIFLSSLILEFGRSGECPPSSIELDCITGKKNLFGLNEQTDVMGCFTKHIGDRGSLSDADHLRANSSEKGISFHRVGAEWAEHAEGILYSKGNCSALPAGSLVSDFYQRRGFVDEQTKRSYCILMEKCVRRNDGRWYKGWGVFIGLNSK